MLGCPNSEGTLVNRRKFINTSLAAGGSLALQDKLFGLGRIPEERTLELAATEPTASFPKDFLWGTATAAFQVEGAWNVRIT